MSDHVRKTIKEIRRLSETIPKLSDAICDLKHHGLSERALIVLAADASGVPKSYAEKLFKGFKKMEKLYVRRKKRERKPDTTDTTVQAT